MLYFFFFLELLHDNYSTVDLLMIYEKNEFTSLNYFKSVFMFSVLSSCRQNQKFYRCKNGEWAQGKIVFVDAYYTVAHYNLWY